MLWYALCRRFAVIPLTEDTGLVEWVPNTTGLRHCLQEIYTTEGIFQRSTHQTIRKMYDGFTVRMESTGMKL